MRLINGAFVTQVAIFEVVGVRLTKQLMLLAEQSRQR